MNNSHFFNKIIVVAFACTILIAFGLTGCKNESDDASIKEKTTTTQESFVPTKGLEFNEDGTPTPESAEQILKEEQERQYQEYLDKEHEQIIRDYYLSEPEYDTDPGLPGGH